MLKEADGQISFARASGFLGWIALLGVFILAAHADHWETVRALAADIALLVGALYGLNKFATALENRKPNGDRNG